MVKSWNIHERRFRLPMLISALRLIYGNKPNSWFDAWWARGPDEVTEFWTQILQARANKWKRLHKKAKRKAEETSAAAEGYSPMKSVAHRLQQKLKKRKRKDLDKPKQRSGEKSSPIIVRDSDTSDSSASSGDDARHAASASSSGEPAEKEEKLAPGPETYTKAEIKTYAKMARAIEEVDESKGHSAAVADFIDSEFSDNSDMMVKARRAAKGTWKRGRFIRACEKAGKIMEERSVP